MTIQELIIELEKLITIENETKEIKVEIQSDHTYYGSVEIIGVSVDKNGNLLIDTDDFHE